MKQQENVKYDNLLPVWSTIHYQKQRFIWCKLEEEARHCASLFAVAPELLLPLITIVISPRCDLPLVIISPSRRAKCVPATNPLTVCFAGGLLPSSRCVRWHPPPTPLANDFLQRYLSQLSRRERWHCLHAHSSQTSPNKLSGVWVLTC